MVLSDVWLDHPRTLPALRRLFGGYAEAVEYRPMAFVLCGNFCQRGWEGEGGLKRYTSKCCPHAIDATPGRFCDRLTSTPRRFQCPDGPSDLLPAPPLLPLYHRSWPSGSVVVLSSPSTGYPRHFFFSPDSTNAQSAIRFKSVSITVFWAGACHLPRRPDGANGAEPCQRQRGGRRGYEAIRALVIGNHAKLITANA